MGGPGSGRRPAIDKAHNKALAAADPALSPPQTAVVARAPRGTKYYVTQPTGGSRIQVLTKEEKAFYEGQSDLYMKEFAFTAASDKADLDRLLFQELLDYRWTVQLGKGADYDGIPLAPSVADAYRRNKNDSAKVIDTIKTSLGMTRAERDAKGESLNTYIATMLARAKEFGVVRNKQVIEALKLFNELKSIVGAFDRGNQLEREKMGFEAPEDIVEWVRTVAIPSYDEIDAKWRASTQRYWDQM